MRDIQFFYASVVGGEFAVTSALRAFWWHSFLTSCNSFCSYASDVTSGLSDGYEGLTEKSEKTAARRTAGKLFRRRARSRLRITGVH